MGNMAILAYDGDNAGRMVGQAILADDANALHEASERIVHGHDIVREWVEAHGGQVISGGGDEGVFQVPQEALAEVEQLRKDYEFATKLTMTVGVGSSLSEAGKALMVGKFRGKNQVVQYDQSVESDMAAAQQHLQDGSASPEEAKIGEAYMAKDQPEGQTPDTLSESEDSHSDCPYCQEMDGATDHASDCQYCEEYDAKQGEAGATGDESLDSCPYCQEMHSADEHQHGDDCEHCKEYDAKQAAAGAAPDATATAAPQEDAQSPELQPQGAPNEQVPQEAGQEGSQEVAPPQEVLGQLDQEGQENAEAQVAAQAAQAAAVAPPDSGTLLGDGMIDNVSRPAEFDANTPGDMGMAEEEDEPANPDLGQVLQGGLDQHADQIQKEKVIQMASQALQGFKSQKAILEKAQAQAPELYKSCILMLKAMIEMGKMLGLGQGEGMPADSSNPLDDQGAAPAQSQAAPQAAPPAAPKEGAAPAPKPDRQ